MNTAVPAPDPAVLARGHDLGQRIASIMADVATWIGEVTPDNSTKFLTAEGHGRNIQASLQSAKVDLGTLALTLAQR